ncbi:arrestin domain-containing protein 3-like protein [Leptotrombidium deliense]|uniref:Arrestin domain-containing protein 3-like protein n=1 Tax=Leptotrombidium deliense TaxID=299467 RepID=A0A443SVT5_9ACAR|nr:arrestin domain-containing protein 3-like protein [Leptotrombidium deliense]
MTRKLKRFLIILDNENLLYFPGSFLTGKVLLELDDETPAIGLYFHIIGEGVVRLNDRRRVAHSDKENYIDFRMRLLGDGGTKSEAGSLINGGAASSIGGRVLLLSPGIHTFPFKLGLPLGLPSTFLGKHGWVQYYCRAILKEPNAFVHKNHQVFIVMNPIDLNLEPSLLLQPFHCEVQEKVGVRCINKGAVNCRVRLDRGGYVPGESIKIYAHVENGSKCTIKQTRAVLTETIQYTVKNKIMKSEIKELASIERGKIIGNAADQWRGELLYIPPIPPTNLRGCHLIRVQYDVYFIVKVKGNKSIRLQLPIMMANYPIRNKDGTLQRRKGTHYPTSLPIARPWIDSNTLRK